METEAQALFSGMSSGLNVSLYGQRIWYKLPFEDLKILCDGSDNFQRMSAAANWTRAVDIYMEEDNYMKMRFMELMKVVDRLVVKLFLNMMFVLKKLWLTLLMRKRLRRKEILLRFQTVRKIKMQALTRHGEVEVGS